MCVLFDQGVLGTGEDIGQSGLVQVLERGDDGCGRLLEVEAFEFPGQAHALAVAGLVLKQQDMVLRREDADAAVVVGIPVFAVDWQDGHGRELGVRRQVGRDVHDGAERDIAQVGRRAVIADHAVGQHRERVRVVTTEDANAEDTEAAAAVDVIDEHEFAPVGVGFREFRELAGFRAVGTRCLFLVLCSWCFVSRKSARNHQQ